MDTSLGWGEAGWIQRKKSQTLQKPSPKARGAEVPPSGGSGLRVAVLSARRAKGGTVVHPAARSGGEIAWIAQVMPLPSLPDVGVA